MSLSRLARFPLLKLPWLCIECVIKTWDILDIIFFALVSQKTRRIVKHLKIPLNGIRITLSDRKRIDLGNFSREWHFWNESEKESLLKEKNPLVLQKDSFSLYTSKTDVLLESYSNENEFIALKMAIEFLNEVFKCSVKRVDVYNDNYPESGDIGVRSTMNLNIIHPNSQSLSHAQGQKLNLLLENLEVTGTCKFWMPNPKKGFYCDPKLFKCKKLLFLAGSAAWVTRDILLQFEVAQLKFYHCPLSVKDILSFVTNWFHSDNKKLEYLHIYIESAQFSLENFQTEELNPVPFSERTRVPPSESDLMLFEEFDFSEGLEIVRYDGLEATIHLTRGLFVFYIWHNQ